MRRMLSNILIVLILTILILLSYAFVEKRLSGFSPGSLKEFFSEHMPSPGGLKKDGNHKQKEKSGKDSADTLSYHAVWLSYIEFNSFMNSARENDKESFKKFYQHILDRCTELGIDHIIVHVRPFGDALYESDLYPWAGCISGEQGRSPGYDPLKIMVDLTHKNNMKFEAWINPYRVSSGDDIRELSVDNPARKWREDKETARNVLTYDHALYYNPSSRQVRDLIMKGVEEIVTGYDVDGIHMDDYFYPVFQDDNYMIAFDAREYKAGVENGDIPESMTIAEWRRYNVNQLVSGIYKRIKKIRPTVTFGISPAGQLSSLRSDIAYYTDIDTWVTKDGYIDYIMPQIYWGYTNTEAPFGDVLKEWDDLCKDSEVKLYVGLQLYRLGIDDTTVSDYKELQRPEVVLKQIRQVTKDPEVEGYCLFSYQYLDPDDTEYGFFSTEFSGKRKKILQKVVKHLKK